jgi:hypothetical protein
MEDKVQERKNKVHHSVCTISERKSSNAAGLTRDTTSSCRDPTPHFKPATLADLQSFGSLGLPGMAELLPIPTVPFNFLYLKVKYMCLEQQTCNNNDIKKKAGRTKLVKD